MTSMMERPLVKRLAIKAWPTKEGWIWRLDKDAGQPVTDFRFLSGGSPVLKAQGFVRWNAGFVQLRMHHSLRPSAVCMIFITSQEKPVRTYVNPPEGTFSGR
jgi:hypothetical protein